jgi:hypothetical protein
MRFLGLKIRTTVVFKQWGRQQPAPPTNCDPSLGTKGSFINSPSSGASASLDIGHVAGCKVIDIGVGIKR